MIRYRSALMSENDHNSIISAILVSITAYKRIFDKLNKLLPKDLVEVVTNRW